MGYRLRREFEQKSTSQAIIPLDEIFQLTVGDSAATLERKALLAVANSMIKHHDLLKRGGHDVPDVVDLQKWINAPLIKGGGAGASVAGFGGSASRSVSVNTGAGFNEAGLRDTVFGWLRQCFPSSQSGAFVGVIDNLELLETSKEARALLESMRDGILSSPGLKWVLCGARGIVRTSASSPRLEGRLAEPLELSPIEDAEISQVIARRLELYQIIDSAVAPVDPESFKLIYDVLNKNLRNALKYSEDFSFWLHDGGYASADPVANRQHFERWIRGQAARNAEETNLSGNRAWEVFDSLTGIGGSCSPGDYETFGFNSAQAMVPHIKSLEDVNLIQSTASDSDRRRKTILVTPRGWLVRYARSDYSIPE
ncbi:hypothetical protein [Nocardia jiangxiensis]|uniref:hypothetical protein n=1 Tax=Nocardia jiangxiensis TaxID=282685 RepID=UPI0012F68468|nr:hypothetical protein [Nocardia jiangxiensis]